MSFWGNIQQKSSDTKSRYALVFSSVITGIIAIIWISTLPAQFSNIHIKDEVSSDTKGSSFTELLNTADDQLGNVIESVDEVKDSVIDTANMDALNMDVIPVGNDGAQSTSSDMIVEQESNTFILKEVLPEEQESAPRVILIGTTTSQNTE